MAVRVREGFEGTPIGGILDYDVILRTQAAPDYELERLLGAARDENLVGLCRCARGGIELGDAFAKLWKAAGVVALVP
ncbi:hypothetical protein D7I44_04655 [Gryllotalpicola protaetiae]|uniref:Uncharacterized protein n=1 Tax=Gryllotalpicola protaetiae TaxID=2419771 RepID=A0A387BX20_9MICO|nr:hypothetical protein D7I44_04655 [Gryllotalpicola protaetiae]